MAARKMWWMNAAHRRLADRYELVEVIGRGGMGTVYRATDLLLDRSVAVKILPGQLAEQDPTSVARFQREARAAAALNHPAVVAVYDTGADQESRFIVMELIEGRSLERILSEDGPFAPDQAAGIAARVADALAAAHAAGIVHRDVKPANVMITQDGSVKVLDFGIARAIDGTALTQHDSVLGTAAYMSPEQALGESADARSDIYALGCVLYALLAGHPPFTGDAVAAILNQHAYATPRTLRSEGARVPRALDALVMQMLAKAPNDRPQTANDVRDRLADRSAGTLAAARAVPRTARQDPTAATQLLSPAEHPDRRRRLLAGAGLLGAVVLVIAVIALASGSSRSHHPTTPHHASKTSKQPATRSGARSQNTAATTATTAATTPSATTASTSATTPTTASTPTTVAGTAGALTALTTQDVQSGTIDQQAVQQISNGLMNVLHAWEMGNTMDAQHQLTNLSQQVTMLEQHGDITATAAPSINQAVANLNTALTHTTPPTTTPGGQPEQPGGQPTQPPGHGGQPPGQAKKHDHGH